MSPSLNCPNEFHVGDKRWYDPPLPATPVPQFARSPRAPVGLEPLKLGSLNKIPPATLLLTPQS